MPCSAALDRYPRASHPPPATRLVPRRVGRRHPERTRTRRGRTPAHARTHARAATRTTDRRTGCQPYHLRRVKAAFCERDWRSTHRSSEVYPEHHSWDARYTPTRACSTPPTPANPALAHNLTTPTAPRTDGQR